MKSQGDQFVVLNVQRVILVHRLCRTACDTYDRAMRLFGLSKALISCARQRLLDSDGDASVASGERALAVEYPDV